MHRNLSHSPCLRREQQNFKFAQRMMLISQQQKMKHNPLKYTVQLKLSFLAFRMLDWVKLCISLLPHSTMHCSVHTRGVQYNYTLQEQRPSSSYHRDNQITAENKTTIATEDLRTGRQGERKGREPQVWKNVSWEAKLQIFFWKIISVECSYTVSLSYTSCTYLNLKGKLLYQKSYIWPCN